MIFNKFKSPPTGIFNPAFFRKIKSISVVVTSFMILIVLVCVCIIYFDSANASSDDAISDTSKIYLHEIAKQKQHQIHLNIDSLFSQLKVTAETLSPSEISNIEYRKDFLSRMRKVNNFDFLAIADKQGIIHTDKKCFTGISKFSFFGKDFSNGLVEFNNTLSEKNLVLVIIPLDSEKFGETGFNILVAGIDAAIIAERLSLFEQNTNIICELIDTNGSYIMQAPQDHLGSTSNFLSAMDYYAVYDNGYYHQTLEKSLKNNTSDFTSYTINGKRYFTYLIPVDSTSGVMIITMPYNVVSGGVNAVRSTLIRNGIMVIIIIIFIFICTFSFYYQMRKRQDEIIMAQIKAEENNRAKTEFLSQMSHDIRTPMNAVISFTNFAIEEDDISVIKEDYLPKIRSSSSHLLMLINEVLEMSRIESGKLELSINPCNIVKISEETISMLQVQTKEKNIALSISTNVKNEFVYGDRLKLDQILVNFFSNAVKFTPEGGTINITLKQNEIDDKNIGEYEMAFSDTGIGMSDDFVKRVFEPFERERTSTVSGIEGTGLGLAIVKKIVDAMGGCISVESQKDEGTTFTVRLRFRLVEPELISGLELESQSKCKVSFEEMKEKFKGKRLLLVEDNEFNRIISETVLGEAGFIIETAEDGSVAVEMVKRVPADYYNVILMDIQMPIMNGYEATRVIRSLDDERSNIKIIAVTANAFESDIKDAKDAGMNEHISKPINVEELCEVLLKEIV